LGQIIDTRVAFIAEGRTLSVANSIVPVDTTLDLPVQAGATYLVDGYLTVSCLAASGFLLNAGGSSATVSGMGLNTWAWAGATLESQVNATSLNANMVALTLALSAIVIKGSIFVNAAGTFGLQFAQNVSGASSSNIFPGSYLKLTRVG
jgi:hypothetical protein